MLLLQYQASCASDTFYIPLEGALVETEFSYLHSCLVMMMMMMMPDADVFASQ